MDADKARKVEIYNIIKDLLFFAKEFRFYPV